MAVIYSDDFQSYSVGATAPFVTGSGTLTPTGFFAATISTNTGGGIFGDAKYAAIPSISGLRYNAGALYTGASSTFFGVRMLDNNLQGRLFSVLSSTSTTLAYTFLNQDCTISIYGGSNATPAVTSAAAALDIGQWHWIQNNYTFAHVGTSVLMDASITVDDKLICSVAAFDTGVNNTGLGGIGPNVFDFGPRFDMGRMTIEDGVPSGTDPNPGTPNLRVTQGLGELYEVPNSANVRITQGIGEIFELPNSANVRVTQGIIEIYIHTQGGPKVYEA